MLVVFGIQCTDAIQEAREFLVEDYLLHGIEDCHIFFVFNMAIAEVMRMFREGTQKRHKFCHELKTLQWPSKPKVDTKTTDAGRVPLIETNPRREEKDKQQGGKAGNKERFDKSPPLHARWGATGRSER